MQFRGDDGCDDGSIVSDGVGCMIDALRTNSQMGLGKAMTAGMAGGITEVQKCMNMDDWMSDWRNA